MGVDSLFFDSGEHASNPHTRGRLPIVCVCAESKAIHASDEVQSEKQRVELLHLLVSATKKFNEAQHTVPFTKPDETKRAAQQKAQEPDLITIAKDSEVASGASSAPHYARACHYKRVFAQARRGLKLHH